MHRLPILLALAACHPSPRPAAVRADLVWTATQGYGVQPAGEDKGVVYAFVHIEAPTAGRIGVVAVHLERDGVACARPTTAVKLDRIDAVTKTTATRELTLDALAHGAPFDGTLASGANFVRIAVEVDHLCGGHDAEPSIAIHLDDGEVLVQRVDESMPT